MATLQNFRFLQHKYRCAEFHSDASNTASSVYCAVRGPDFIIRKTINFHNTIRYSDYLSAVQALSSKKRSKV